MRPTHISPVKVLVMPALAAVELAQPIVLAETVNTAVTPTVAAYSGSGDASLDQIIAHESGGCAFKWQGETGGCPAYHGVPSDGSGLGYGLCQSTPPSKMSSSGADWATNPATQIAWCTSYAIARYGSTVAAWAHWQVFHNW